MTLRTRVALLLAMLVALSTAVSGLLSYRATRSESMASIDAFLEVRADRFEPGFPPPHSSPRPPRGVPPPRADGSPPPGPDGSVPPRPPALDAFEAQTLDDIVGNDSVFGVLDVNDEIIMTTRPDLLDFAAMPIARGDVVLGNVTVDGVRYRVRTERFADGSQSVNARSLTETDETLGAVRTRLLLVAVVVTLLAALVGFVAAGYLSRPLRKLSRAAEEVAESGELSSELDTNASGEVGQLAGSFERMLDALAQSHEQQQRLIAAASHELRTPLTTIRANVDMLAAGKLDAADTSTAHDLIRMEVDELVNLSTELSDLAVAESSVLSTERVDLVDLARSRIDREMARHRRHIDLAVPKRGTVVVDGNADALDRALSNLIGNAVKFSKPNTRLVVRVEHDRISVIDHGQGIPLADVPHVFERFHRADNVRNAPGSGLGLSIVQETARAHGGKTFARNHPQGATVGFTFRSQNRSTTTPD